MVARDASSTTPLSNFVDVESPTTLTSVGSTIATHAAQEIKPTQRENNNNEDIDHSSMHVLPPIKNNCILSILSPKARIGPTLASNFRSNNHRMHTPKVFVFVFFHSCTSLILFLNFIYIEKVILVGGVEKNIHPLLLSNSLYLFNIFRITNYKVIIHSGCFERHKIDERNKKSSHDAP